MATVFLKPRSIDLPPQGSFEFQPKVKVVEATSAAALEAALSGGISSINAEPDIYVVIESIEYQVVEASPDNLYSALIHYTQVDIV